MIDDLDFDAKRILVLGDAILDEYLSGDCSRLSPEAPVPVLRVSECRRVLGGAANTAANVASLGARVALIALAGNDSGADDLNALSRHAGIDLDPVRDGRPTLRKVRVVGQRQQLVRLDYEEPHPVSAATEREILARVHDRIDDCDIVIISDYAKGVVTERVCQGVIHLAHKKGKEVVVDPRPQHKTFYRDCDYLTPNWKESQGLLGVVEGGATPDAIRDVGEALTRQLNTSVLLTLGAHGMAFFGRDGREQFSLPTMAKEVFDVSGAGDTVVAAFALARACGASHVDAATLANQAAGIVVGKLGTATVTREDLARGGRGEGRLIARHQLTALADGLRQRGKRIVTTNGSFDLVHAGHLHFLREASRLGDTLIVGLNSDESVRAYKGPSRPIIPEAQRAEMLLSLRSVDYVHVFDETAPMAFLEHVRPDVHVNGAEYGERCIEADTVERFGGRVHLVDRIPDLATTNILQRLSSLARA